MAKFLLLYAADAPTAGGGNSILQADSEELLSGHPHTEIGTIDVLEIRPRAGAGEGGTGDRRQDLLLLRRGAEMPAPADSRQPGPSGPEVDGRVRRGTARRVTSG